MVRLYHRGFTLVEILIVVAIITVLTSIAVPTYSKMRSGTRASICKANLRQINGAIEQWALYNEVPGGTDLTPYEDEIYNFLYEGKPCCPSGGTYNLIRLDAVPQVICTVEGHEYP